MRVEVTDLGRAGHSVPAARPMVATRKGRRARSDAPHHQIDLDLFSDSINGSRCMADVPQIETERNFHETKFVFHLFVEAWAKTPNGKKRETTHVVLCETEIFRVKS